MKDKNKSKEQLINEIKKWEAKHKRTEELLRKSEEHYNSLLETIPYGIQEIDTSGIISFANKAYDKIFGFEKGEAIGTSILDKLAHDSERKKLADYLKTLVKDQPPLTPYFEKNITKEGKIIDVQVDWNYKRDKKGSVVGLISVITDITKRKQSEKVFRKTKDYLDNIIESSLDVVVVSDSRGYITRVNKAFFELTGYRGKEVIGKHITELTPYEERTYESTSGEMVEIKEFISDALEVIEKPLFVEGKTSNWETYYLCKDGKIAPVETNIAYLYNEEGDAIGSVGVNRDISERKRSERKIIEYQNELRSFASQLTLTEEKERQKFATYLHDQIGQKLFVLKLKMEMLKKSESLKEMVKSSEEIFKLIDQIIKETRNLTFEISPPILHQLGLEAAIEWLTEKMHKQHSIVVDFEDDKREKTVDEYMKILLFQAVRELLTNIIKHAQSQKAKVSIKRDKTHLRVCVEDDGAGFIPLDKYSSKDKNGGFGLFSIKERLDHLGGHLKITSQSGLGTQATLLAPLKGKKESLNGK